MKKVTDISNLSRIRQGSTLEKPLKQWNQQTEALTLGIFARFADLFQNKCRVQGIVIFEIEPDEDRGIDGKYTETFKLWCVKLEQANITVEGVQRGIKHLEASIRDAVRVDNEVWPCSYAEFIGHCQEQKERGKMWKGLPAPTMTNEERKKEMKKLLDDLKGKL